MISLDLSAKIIYNSMTAFVFIFGSLTLYTWFGLWAFNSRRNKHVLNFRTFFWRSGTTKPKVTFTP